MFLLLVIIIGKQNNPTSLGESRNRAETKVLNEEILKKETVVERKRMERQSGVKEDAILY